MLSTASRENESTELVLSENGKCPFCKNKILKSESDNKQILLGKLSIFEDGKFMVKCKACTKFVILPLEMLKALKIPVKIGDKTYKMSLINQ